MHNIAAELPTYSCCNSVCIASATPNTNIKYKATQKSVCTHYPYISILPSISFDQPEHKSKALLVKQFLVSKIISASLWQKVSIMFFHDVVLQKLPTPIIVSTEIVNFSWKANMLLELSLMIWHQGVLSALFSLFLTNFLLAHGHLDYHNQ